MRNQSQKTILITDDQKTNRRMLQLMLKKNGYLTIEAASGFDCIRAVKEQNPDLILLDIMMPDISGIDVCRRLRNDVRVAMIPILFVTAATDDRTLSHAFDAGGNDYVRKPINKVELLKRIQAVFDLEKLIQKDKDEEKLQSVLSMSGTICHELNQPLQYISGASQLLLMDLDRNTPAYEKVSKMKTQIDRMGEITKKLMRITRVDAVNYLGGTKILSINR